MKISFWGKKVQLYTSSSKLDFAWGSNKKIALTLRSPIDNDKTWLFAALEKLDRAIFIITGSISFLPPYARKEIKELAPQADAQWRFLNLKSF